jgi:hypothetical protein
VRPVDEVKSAVGTPVDIPFNRPKLGKELDYIRQAISRGQLAGDGAFTERCQLPRRRHRRAAVLLTRCVIAGGRPIRFGSWRRTMRLRMHRRVG